MRTTNILHVTDFHLNTVQPKQIGKAISASLHTEIVGEDFLGRFLADVKRLLQDMQIDVIAYTGDLGWKAAKESITLGVEYLAKMARDLGIEPEHVMVAPGNHDLDRDASKGEELDYLCEQCEKQGFTHSKRSEPAVYFDKGIPFISLNTCLGGTEHAYHGLPDEFWNAELQMLKEKEAASNISTLIEGNRADLSYQVQAMDIPAIGTKQMDCCCEALGEAVGNCAVLLMHHNPVPTSQIDIRPYANLIDSGPLLTRLMTNGQHIIILHGHTHSESGLTMHPHLGDEGGFVASIGNNGLSAQPSASASLLEITTTDRNEFISANIYGIVRNAALFVRKYQYTLRERLLDYFIPQWDLDKLPKNRTLTFTELAQKVDILANESLAEDLIRLDPVSLKITGKGQPAEKWRIKRIR